LSVAASSCFFLCDGCSILGTIPEWMEELTNLHDLHVYGNLFTGTGCI
jgi:hypothetical protein